MRWHKNKVRTYVCIAVALLLTAVMCIDLFPLLWDVDLKQQSAVVRYMNAFGAKGALILVALQLFQVVTALFPAPPIQLVAGLCYGMWWGLLITIAGSLAGSALVFVAVRKVDKTFAPHLPHKTHKEQNSVFSTALLRQLQMRPWAVVFWLYAIPRLHNGLLPFVYARTQLPWWKYGLAATLGSALPAMVHMYIGLQFAQGNTIKASWLCLCVNFFYIGVDSYKDKILSFIEKRQDLNVQDAR